MKPEMTRRNALAALGTAGLGGLLAACGGNDDDGDASSTTSSSTSTAADGATSTAAPSAGSDLAALFEDASSCSLTPEETEGPYYIDVDSIRSDIRDGRPGADLRIAIRVLDESCEPVPDAVVEIWHCDSLGTYSGFESQSQQANSGPGANPGDGNGNGNGTDSTRYLRGGQVTDTDGIAQIRTIYPGWYMGRTVHIHSKVHINNGEVLTTQLYFDDQVSDALFASTDPYSQHTGREVTNENDGIFHRENVLTLAEDGDSGGYLGVITFNVDRG